jgi:glycosyltransferase involved in cell wall biosynthesis
MKIVLVTPNYAPEQGACAERVRYLAEFLREKGHEILVITALPNYPKGKIFDSYRHIFHKTETINDIKVLRYWVFASHSKNLIFRLLAMLSLAITLLFSLPKVLKFRPNFVFVQSPPLFLAISGYLMAKLCKAKFWLNLSDLWSSVLIDLQILSNSFLYKFIKKLEHFLYHKADLISGQSQEIIDEINNILQDKKSNYKANSKILLSRTGVNCDLFQPVADFSPQKVACCGLKSAATDNDNPKKIKLVYAGLLGIAQGVFEFCKAANLPENVEFHIYGEGAERNMIAKYLLANPQKPIFLHFALSQKDLALVLPNFDAALILQQKSIFGTVPSKLYEAMACGLLILYVGGGEGGKLIEKFDIGLPLLSIQECEMAIEILAKSLDTKLEIGKNITKRKNARIAAENYFDRTKILEEFYRKAFEE